MNTSDAHTRNANAVQCENRRCYATHALHYTFTPALQKDEKDNDILIAAVTSLGNLRLSGTMPILAYMAKQPDLELKSAAIFAISEIAAATPVRDFPKK